MTLAVAIKSNDTIFLAADRRVCSTAHGLYEEKKIREWGGGYLAFAGDTTAEQHLLTFREMDVTPEYWAAAIAPIMVNVCKEYEVDYDCLFVRGTKVYVTDGHFLRESASTVTAIGSGAVFAYGYISGYCRGAEPVLIEQRGDVVWDSITTGELYKCTSSFTESVGAQCDIVYVKGDKKRKSKR